MRFNPIGNEFAAVVEGIDLCAPLNSAQVATIHAGMDRHAVLVFHDQPLTDEQQIAFTRSLGKIELNTANNITRLDQRRLSIEMSDISNLDQHSNIMAIVIAANSACIRRDSGVRRAKAVRAQQDYARCAWPSMPDYVSETHDAAN